MEDNVIKVSVRPNKQNSVKVSSNVVSTPITANSDTSQLWSQVSKNWAISEVLVDNTDYSSKYYANKAKESASNAQGFESSVRDIYNEFLGETTEAIENVQGARDEAIANIETSRVVAIDSINSTKTTIINDIEFVADGEKQEINDLADVIKDNADSIINRVGISMFDTILKDHLLTYEESKGLALQGTYVYKEAVAGSSYGYPDFYNKVLEEYNEATTTETVNGVTVKVHSNGHKFYDIADKGAIDTFFSAMGSAWFYGVDTANERVFLPRDSFFAIKGIAPVVGNGMGLGLTDGTNNFSALRSAYQYGPVYANEKLYGSNVGSTATPSEISTIDVALGVTTDPTKSGIEAHIEANEDKYLYICVGNTVSDTSWVDVVTQVEGGVKDLEDKKNASIAEIDANAKSYDNLTKRQIANCLLEVPQNIKIELNNGVLTLKAGSKVIVPNGVGVFDEVNIASDINFTYTYAPSTDTPCMLFINKQGTNFIFARTVAACSSGTTQPSGSYRNWYNTTENKMYSIGNNATVDGSGFSFPIAIITQGSDGVTKSIDQVFNGMGFIGSHLWVDKGVKALAPNGRNKDGSLNNVEITTTKVSTYTRSLNGDVPLWLDVNGLSLSAGNAYDEKRNVIYVIGDKQTTLVRCQVAMTNLTGGKINSFQPKLPFRAVDYNNFNKSINTLSKAYITETYVNGKSWYRVYSDGWCEQGGLFDYGSLTKDNPGRIVNLLKKFTNANYTITGNIIRDDVLANANNGLCALPVGFYAPTENSFYLRWYTYQTNEIARYSTWTACGYIN